jgi:hypothetical protein
MNIVCKYDESSVELEGSTINLLELAGKIQQIDGVQLISLFHPVASPGPYLGYADVLRLELSTGDVYVWRREAEGTISGSREKLEILAGNIESFANDESRDSGNIKDHIHIEYYPNHFYLKKESIPLVITKRAAGDEAR